MGPTKVRDIIKNTVKKSSPPYGYILVAPAKISKNSYDTFRETLRKLGVREFYLWGRSELEDMLFMPKNDHILFAFFGFSLIVKQKTRKSLLKFAINNKNKLMKVIFGGECTQPVYKPVLIRDFGAELYPWKGEYPNFDKKPKWKVYTAYYLSARSLQLITKEHFAYVDTVKKTWDRITTTNLRQPDMNMEQNANDSKQRASAENYWDHLPNKNKTKLVVYGLIDYEDMLIIDDKGDTLFRYPHIFVDFHGENGPFSGFIYMLEKENNEPVRLDDAYKRENIFPNKLPPIKEQNIYEAADYAINDAVARQLIKGWSASELYSLDGKYDALKPHDVLHFPKQDDRNEEAYLEVTYKYSTTFGEYLKENRQGSGVNIENQIGRLPKKKEVLTVLEVKNVWKWNIIDK